ncbi:hypothetical protein U1Q18_035129, partial [Sarracenia purpurea var. burkii]
IAWREGDKVGDRHVVVARIRKACGVRDQDVSTAMPEPPDPTGLFFRRSCWPTTATAGRRTRQPLLLQTWHVRQVP